MIKLREYFINVKKIINNDYTFLPFDVLPNFCVNNFIEFLNFYLFEEKYTNNQIFKGHSIHRTCHQYIVPDILHGQKICFLNSKF